MAGAREFCRVRGDSLRDECVNAGRYVSTGWGALVPVRMVRMSEITISL